MLYRSLTLCKTAIVDARSNNISLINILDDIQVIGFPTIISNLSVVIILQKESTDTESTYRFVLTMKLNEKELFSQPIFASFMEKSKSRSIIDLKGFPITSDGTLLVELHYEDSTVMSSSIEVQLPKRPEATQRDESEDRKE